MKIRVGQLLNKRYYMRTNNFLKRKKIRSFQICSSFLYELLKLQVWKGWTGKYHSKFCALSLVVPVTGQWPKLFQSPTPFQSPAITCHSSQVPGVQTAAKMWTTQILNGTLSWSPKASTALPALNLLTVLFFVVPLWWSSLWNWPFLSNKAIWHH